MTISTEVRKAGPFIGNDSASVFPFAFKVFKAADLIVVRRQDNIGTETTLVLDSDYHVTLNGNQDTTPGGVVTLVAGALASGFTLVVSSELPYLQPTDLTNQGGFYPKVITNALDRLTIFCQQLAEITGRTLKLPITAPTNISAEIPLPNPSELIAWDETGTRLTTVSPQSLVTSIAYGSATADLFAGDGVTTTFPLTTNPASVNNLDVSIGGYSQRPVQDGVGDYSWNGGASITFVTPPPAPTVPGDKNVLVRYMQAIPVSDSEALHAQTREALRRSYAEAGFNLVDGSFETGGTLTAATDVLLQESTGATYAWAGTLPHAVAPGADPTAVSGYVPRTDVTLREDLASAIGAALVSWQGSEAYKLKKTLEDRFNSAFVVDFATDYLTMDEIAQIKIDYTVGATNQKPTVDITARLIQAIADLGGSHDITGAYLYEPAKVLQLPAGAMGLNLAAMSRVLIDRNNINIRGAGMFNTRLCHIGTGHAQEMIRFKEAYACGLSHMTLDGGMPWRPNGTETYGVDVPLVLDQCAHFYSEGLNLCNYRHRGLQAIHLWESYFDDFRCFNGGWLRTGTTRAPGGIFFDDYLKESTAFSGSESNQVYFGKYAFSGVGATYHFISPCFNIHFNHVVSEGMTFNSGYLPSGLNVPKVAVDGISAGIVVDHAWYYFHDQPITSGQQSVLFDFTNAGPGCKFDNQVVIQEIPVGSSNLLEVSTFVNNASAYPVTVNASISDANCTTLFGNAVAGALLQGDIFYRKDSARTIENWMGTYGPSNFIGKVTMSTGAFDGTPPVVYQYDGRSVTLSAIDGAGSFAEYKCRAIANFNGTTGTSRMQKGMTVTKQATGTYSATFDKQMPDANYSICHALQKASSNTDSFDIGTMTQNGFSFVVKNSAGTLVDALVICLTVFR